MPAKELQAIKQVVLMSWIFFSIVVLRLGVCYRGQLGNTG